MTHSDILSLRRQLKPEKAAISKLHFCHVDKGKAQFTMFSEDYSALPDEESERYLALFKKGLSGIEGRNLFTLSFPLEEEMGGKAERLTKLWEEGRTGAGSREIITASFSGSVDRLEGMERHLAEMYHTIATTYNTDCDKYCIITAFGSYDVPRRSDDVLDNLPGTPSEEGGEEVYDYMIRCICPLILDDPGLGYDAELGRICKLPKEWTLQVSDKAFLYPGMTDGSVDIHEVVYYSRKTEELQAEMAYELFGIAPYMTVNDQKEAFAEMVEEVELGLEGLKDLQDRAVEYMEERAETGDAGEAEDAVDKRDMRLILERTGVEPEKLEEFEQHFEEKMGKEGTLRLSNVVDMKTARISVPGLEIKMNQDMMDRVVTMEINGRNCLVIEIEDEMEFNGISVKP